MFYYLHKIRCLIDTLRAYAEEQPIRRIIRNHELHILVQAIFSNSDTVINPTPLPETGQDLWTQVVRLSRTKFSSEKARPAALAFAAWLQKQYLPNNRILFDPESTSVMVDGKMFIKLQPVQYALLKVLSDRQGVYVSTDAIIESINTGGAGLKPDPVLLKLAPFPSGETGKRRISRARKSMHKDLHNLIEGRERNGRRLVLSAQ